MHANLVLMIAVAVLALALLLWLFAASRRTRVAREERPGEELARRNQALIDAPPAATIAPVVPDMPVAAPVAADALAAPAAIALGAQDGDHLTSIKGVGPRLADQLRNLGVSRFSQIAQWDETDIDRIDAQLGRFQGRIRRDDWREQARLLAAGDTAAYQARFGKL